MLVMIACLKKIDPISTHKIHEAVLLRDATGPCPLREVLQWFRFADTHKRIAHDCLNQIKDAKRDRPVHRDPVAKILTEFAVKHRLTPAGGLLTGDRFVGTSTLTGGAQPPSLSEARPPTVALADASRHAEGL